MVDVNWTIQETAFGDPSAHLNFRLNTMRAVQPLTDKVIEINPAKATTWFLQYESAIEAILRLGKRNAELGIQCFNVTML